MVRVDQGRRRHLGQAPQRDSGITFTTNIPRWVYDQLLHRSMLDGIGPAAYATPAQLDLDQQDDGRNQDRVTNFPGWHPAAVAEIAWLPAAAGGRVSGPPRPGDYAANVVFLSEGEPERTDPWNAESYMSIVVRIDASGSGVAEVGFLAPEMASRYLRAGRGILLMEGPDVVGEGTIVSLLP